MSALRALYLIFSTFEHHAKGGARAARYITPGFGGILRAAWWCSMFKGISKHGNKQLLEAC